MKVFGNKKTKVAHAARKKNDACRQLEIRRPNVVKFDSLGDAEVEGYRACKICKPE